MHHHHHFNLKMEPCTRPAKPCPLAMDGGVRSNYKYVPVWRLGICRLCCFLSNNQHRDYYPRIDFEVDLSMGRGGSGLRLSNFDPKLTEPLSSPNPWRPKLTPGLNNSFSKSHFFFLYYHHPYRKPSISETEE